MPDIKIDGKEKVLFYLCHGIRTTKKEAECLVSKFEDVCYDYYKCHKVKEYKIIDGSYGWVGVFANILPIVRRMVSNQIRKDFEYVLKPYYEQGYKIVIITYSYSTYLVSEILQDKAFAKKLGMNIESWVLYGGVVHCKYRFEDIKFKLNRVFNFCSTEDEVCRYAPFFFDYGHCGAWGFRLFSGSEANSNGPKEELFRISPCVGYNFHFNNVEHSGEFGWFSRLSFILVLLDRLRFGHA